MDRLVEEKVETEKKIEAEQKFEEEQKEKPQTLEIKPSQEPQIQTEYLSSLENKTIADIKRENEKEEKRQFEIQRQELIEKQFEQSEKKEEKQESQNIIERPNYDLIEEKKTTIKIKNRTQKSPKKAKKTASILLSIALGISTIFCVTNTILLDNFSASYQQIDSTYQLNLFKYLNNISKLDTTKQSMEFLETYPDEELDAGTIGEKTNWFDRFCNFFAKIFGG